MKKTHIICMLVKNEAGVLTRIAALFTRRGFNIDSLSVGVTTNPDLSRITITSRGDDYTEKQIISQIEKLHDVLVVENMRPSTTITRELLFVKVAADIEQRSNIIEAAKVFRGNVVDFSKEALTIEITGDSEKCSAFLEYLEPYGILEVCRTGLTAISRGEQMLKVKQKAKKSA